MSLLSGKEVRRPSGLLSELLQEAEPHPSPGRIFTRILSFRCREGLSSSVVSDQHLLFGGTAGSPAGGRSCGSRAGGFGGVHKFTKRTNSNPTSA